MRVAIYARVSTSQQDTDNQVPVLTDICKQRGWTLTYVKAEDDSAWKAGHQPELAWLLQRAKAHEFDVLLVWALDRLTREGALAILQLVSTCQKYGVRIVSYQESWTEAPGDLADILYAIAGWVARMESQRRSERTKAGLARAKDQQKGIRGKDKKQRSRRWRRRPAVVPEDAMDAIKALPTEEVLKLALAGWEASRSNRAGPSVPKEGG